MSKIQLNNLSKNYNETVALKNINLTFESKKIYGLLGRNGAGKTTLLNIISNRIFATTGEIIINDTNLYQIQPQLSNVYVAGEANLYPEGMKLQEVFKWTKEFFSGFDMDLAQKLAKEFELPMRKKVKSLSTGYQTILKDILALCVNTEFVFFDEPVLGLDANHRDMFYKDLLQCYLNNDSTFIVSTHLIDEIATIIENVIIIDKGEIIKDTTCEELLSMGYTVSGTTENVDAFTKDKNIIGEDILGNMKAAYILHEGELPANNDLVEISNINLQKLFIELTNGGTKK